LRRSIIGNLLFFDYDSFLWWLHRYNNTIRSVQKLRFAIARLHAVRHIFERVPTIFSTRYI
jgi:hypothetical protein